MNKMKVISNRIIFASFKIIGFLWLFLFLSSPMACHTIDNVVENENDIMMPTDLTDIDPTSTTPQPTFTPSPTPKPTVTETPEFIFSTQTDPDNFQDWTIYINEKYNFSIGFPENWEVLTGLTPSLESNFLILSPKSDSNVQLILGFKWADEEIRIERTGIPAGEIVSEGTLEILGQDITRDVLLYEGKTKAVLYNNGMGIEVNGLIFTINLGADSNKVTYETIDIPSTFQIESEEIITSLVIMP